MRASSYSSVASRGGDKKIEKMSGCVYCGYSDLLPDSAGAAIGDLPNQVAGSSVTLSQTNATYKPTVSINAGKKELLNASAGGLAFGNLSGFTTSEVSLFIVARTTDATLEQWIAQLNNRQVGMMCSSGQQTAATGGGTLWNTAMPMPTTMTAMGFAASASGFAGLGSGCFNFQLDKRGFRSVSINGSAWAGATITSGFIGGIGAGQGTYTRGYYSAVALFNRAVTPTEAKSIMKQLTKRCTAQSFGAPTANLLFAIDSLTVGALGSGPHKSYPDQLTKLPSRFKMTNLAIVGATIADATALISTKVSAAYDPTLKNIVLAFGGTNTLAGAPTDPTSAFNAYKAYCLAVRAMGFIVIAFTMLPRTAGAGFETSRGTYNTAIRNDTSFYDYLADVGADATIGVTGAEQGAQYQSDHLHLVDTGYGIVAGIVDPKLQLALAA